MELEKACFFSMCSDAREATILNEIITTRWKLDCNIENIAQMDQQFMKQRLKYLHNFYQEHTTHT